ncbi:MAG: hypothetical protein A3E37_02610 [Candidatus Andersenbacteria bacterium RIFCSPHIGHO2_12_FULL_46_9]|nr:MAG: hypothetical protein A3B76_03290 [Candidatus Andersenbacteria bacterium RIFCSPHIGHO2_02_FULL_46_16]OGY37411.1 MAG: hypothetical protein A3E37_02610 [Candidatus Andersenbacteria bacterium RIFCSPHIGHO2_12_FULL_46_9]OGY40055.1 MAG: hypothetical protein A3G57_04865 [Candidatus Andersenbacteria bacterium RIFCSPLOWO2_12_FULL_45_8]HBE89996.1 hypothetical protein [Candidatus Andersenbacteria bacterium]
MRNNVLGAGNQQESSTVEIIPLDTGWYLAGFADGEGSFNVSTVNRNHDFKTGWKIVLTFNVCQRDHTILRLFQETLCCGTLRDRGDGVGYYDVRRLDEIVNIVIPFFERFSLRSASKRKQFEVFSKVAYLMKNKAHFTHSGLKNSLELRETIHVARKRKYTSKQILSLFRSRNPQRLYAKS